MTPSRVEQAWWRGAARLVVLGLLSLASVSCGGDAVTAPLQSSLGTLLVPLEAVGESGATYELVDAELALTGSETLTITLDGRSEETRLLAGPYTVTLLDGWDMVRSFAGESDRVDAQLRSANPTRIEIEGGATTSLTLRFRVDGDDIRLGEAPDTPQVAGGGAGGSGASGVDGQQPGSLDPGADAGSGGAGGSGSSSEDDDDEPGDAGAPPVDPPPAELVCSSAQAICLDAIVEAATATADLELCIPANELSTAVGLVAVCGDSQCASGVAGCPVLADASGSRARVQPDGRVTIDAIADLNPLQVPVVIPVPIFGDVTCQVAVSGAVLASAEAEPELGDDGSVSGFALTGIGTSLEQVDLAVAGGGVLCAALEPVLGDMRATLEPQVAAALAESLDDDLDELATRLACARCDGAACPITCIER
jgi:hypothetical protein